MISTAVRHSARRYPGLLPGRDRRVPTSRVAVSPFNEAAIRLSEPRPPLADSSVAAGDPNVIVLMLAA
jgi:hypothetical protein